MTQTNFLKEIEDQALSFLRDYALTAFIFLTITQALLVNFIYIDYPSTWVIYWLLLFFLTQLLSLFYRRQVPTFNIPREEKLFNGMIINIVDGFIVSSCLLFFPFVEQGTKTVLVAVLLITCTGAITTTIGYQKFFLAYTTPILVSIFAVSLHNVIISDGTSNGILILMIGTLVILSVLHQVSTRIFKNFKDAFSARLDVTEINQQLQSAVKTAKLANQSKTRFLASASHDLRQPINVLSLFVANLSLKDTKGEYTDIINHMNTAIYSVDAQLESLLDISKLDAGIVDVKLKETNLVQLTEELVSGYPNSENVQVKFSSEIDNIIVDIDIALFERILNNLVSNAVKYTSKGYVDVSVNCVNGKALIKIKDTGIGIKTTELEHVFDEFYQINNSERDSANGLGLGLSIVKRLAELLAIEITLSSQYGLGTEVELSLDCKHASTPTSLEVETTSITSDICPKRVLVLDNEVGIVVALESVLKSMNHYAETFTCSNNALRCFETKTFDIALIDYRLSDGVLGDDVINRMHTINPQTKFFLVTGDNNIQRSNKFEIIHKPVTGKKLELIFNE